MTTSPLVSVVIPTHDHGELLPDALTSLAQQTEPPSFEVVVVDDGSTDDTAAVLERWRDRNPGFPVQVISQPNAGVNAARNRGIDVARGEIVVLLDADERAPANHLGRIRDHLAHAPELAGVGGPARGVDTHHLRTCERCALGDAVVVADPDGMADRLLGGNMAVRRSLFAEVGLFDADLSGRGDEIEWFARAGRRFRYDPTLVVHHTRAGATAWSLVRTSVRQGRSIPAAAAKMGERWRPSPARLGRALGHSVRRRCVHGLVLAGREVGATAGWLTVRSGPPASSRDPDGPTSRSGDATGTRSEPG